MAEALSGSVEQSTFKDLGPGVRMVVEWVGRGRGGVGVGGGAAAGCWLFSRLHSTLCGAEQSWSSRGQSQA